MRFVGPVFPDGWITEVCYLFQHGTHEGGAQLLGIRGNPTLLSYHILPKPGVEVEGWEAVQEGAAAIHVPDGGGGGGGEGPIGQQTNFLMLDNYALLSKLRE